MTSTGQRRRSGCGYWSSMAVKAVTVEERHNCEAKTLGGSLSDRKTVGVVEETDSKVGAQEEH